MMPVILFFVLLSSYETKDKALLTMTMNTLDTNGGLRA